MAINLVHNDNNKQKTLHEIIPVHAHRSIQLPQVPSQLPLSINELYDNYVYIGQTIITFLQLPSAITESVFHNFIQIIDQENTNNQMWT